MLPKSCFKQMRLINVRETRCGWPFMFSVSFVCPIFNNIYWRARTMFIYKCQINSFSPCTNVFVCFFRAIWYPEWCNARNHRPKQWPAIIIGPWMLHKCLCLKQQRRNFIEFNNWNELIGVVWRKLISYFSVARAAHIWLFWIGQDGNLPWTIRNFVYSPDPNKTEKLSNGVEKFHGKESQREKNTDRNNEQYYEWCATRSLFAIYYIFCVARFDWRFQFWLL